MLSIKNSNKSDVLEKINMKKTPFNNHVRGTFFFYSYLINQFEVLCDYTFFNLNININ